MLGAAAAASSVRHQESISPIIVHYAGYVAARRYLGGFRERAVAVLVEDAATGRGWMPERSDTRLLSASRQPRT